MLHFYDCKQSTLVFFLTRLVDMVIVTILHVVLGDAQDTMVILEEGNRPYLQWDQCGMFVSHKALNVRHMTTEFCWQGAERKWCCLAEEEARAGAETLITAYEIPLSPITSFKYLGRILTVANDDWQAVVNNLRKARRSWEILKRVLGRKGADSRTLVKIYLEVVHSVLLFELETWLMIPRIRRVLGRFHHRLACRLMGRKPRKESDGVWIYPRWRM